MQDNKTSSCILYLLFFRAISCVSVANKKFVGEREIVKNFWKKTETSIWTSNLLLMAYATFLNRFGGGLMDGARTNFLVDTMSLSGGRVLLLEGIRELPGLVLMFVAALFMRMPLSQSSAISVFIMGIGFFLYAFVHSYSALIAVVVLSSLGMHMTMPLNGALTMSMTTKEKTGQVLGSLASVGSLASIVGICVLMLISKFSESLSLRAYFIAGSVFIILAGFLIARIPKHVGTTKINPPRLLIKRHYWLYYVLILLQGSGQQVLDSFCMLLLVKNFGLKVWNISLLLLVSGVVNMIAGPYIGRLIDRYGERKTVPPSYIFLALSCAGFALIHNILILQILFIVTRLFGMFGMGLSTYVRRIAPQEELTPTLSTGISVNHITSVSMPLIAGQLLPSIGFEAIFLGTAIIISISIPFALAMRVRTVSSDQ
jgi:predicted MFS family arabinose efflux permease